MTGLATAYFAIKGFFAIVALAIIVIGATFLGGAYLYEKFFYRRGKCWR